MDAVNVDEFVKKYEEACENYFYELHEGYEPLKLKEAEKELIDLRFVLKNYLRGC